MDSGVPSINLEVEEILPKLVNFGNILLDAPTSDIELLRLLEEFELFLSRISQGNVETFSLSLGPSKRALIGGQLLRHANIDVQISVLSCITEITRITAPEWPYADSEMKEYFLLVVQSLERFSSMSDHFYTKVTSILETIAAIESCLIMMDLQMEGSILGMFENFQTSIQSRPSPDLFSDMVTIMTILLKELDAEGILVDLLSTLLTSVEKGREDVLPISWAMGVEILQNSARHVRPFLTSLVQSLEIDLNDYAEIVAKICSTAAEVENTMDQELAPDSAGANVQLMARPSKSVENDTVQDMDNSLSSEESSLKILQFGNQNTSGERDGITLKDENSQKDMNSGPTKEKKTADLKTIPEAENVNVTVSEEQNHDAQHVDHDISSEQNASKTWAEVENSLKEKAYGVIGVEKARDLGTISEAENVNMNNAVPQEKNDGLKASEKRVRRPKFFRLEEGYYFLGSGDTGYLESPFGWKNYKKRTDRFSSRKNNAVSAGNKSLPAEKPRRKRTSKKKAKVINEHDPEQKQLSSPSSLVCRKRSRGKSASPANCYQESVLEKLSHFDIEPGFHFINKPTPESEHKGKPSSSKGEASRMTYGEKLVGCKIKVWWPLDKEYYEGTVDSFDLSTMKHKVIYDDGDEEILNLMGEDWELVKDIVSLDVFLMSITNATNLQGQEMVQGRASSNPNLSAGPSSKKRKENSSGEKIPGVAGASMEQAEN